METFGSLWGRRWYCGVLQNSCRMDESSFTVSMIDEDLWCSLPEELKSLGVDDIDAEVKKYMESKMPWDCGVTKLLQYE